MQGEIAAGQPVGASRQWHETPDEPFKKINRLATIATVFVVACVVLDVFGVVADLQLVNVLERAKAGEVVTIEEAEGVDTRVQRIGLAQAAGFLVTAIPFILWFRRMYRNLGAAGIRRVRYKPGWAVGGWFVPFLNLARPKAIANDIYRATDPSLPPEAEEPPEGARVSSLLNWWWAAFILSGMLYPSGTTTRNSSIDEFLFEARRYLVADTVSIVSGILAILVIKTLTERLQIRYRIHATARPGQAAEA